MKAASKFKRLLSKKRPEILQGMFGTSGIVQPPDSMNSDSDEGPEAHLSRMQTDNTANRKPIEGNLTTEGIIRNIQVSSGIQTNQSTDKIDLKKKAPIVSKGQWGPILLGAKPHMPFHAEAQKDPQREDNGNSVTQDESARHNLSSNNSKSPPSSRVASPVPINSGVTSPISEPGKGQAHDPLEDTLFLNIGASADAPPSKFDILPVVSESPSAVESGVYEQAYEEEIQKILAARKQEGRKPTLFLTKRVEAIPHLRDHEDITDFDRAKKKPVLGFAALAEMAKSAVAKSRAAKDDGDSGKSIPKENSSTD